MSRSNRWLILLLVAVALKQCWFIISIPAWQVPDEPAHVAYVQALVEQRQAPVFSDQGMDVSREMLRSLTTIENTNPHRLGRHYPPGFLQTPTINDRQLTDHDQPIRNLAARNSPLYYLVVALPYGLTYQATIENRLFAMRVFSSLLLLVTVWLSVRIARQFSNHSWFAITVGAVVGFHPAASLLFAGVNPDAGLTVASTLAFWLMVCPSDARQAHRRALVLAIVIGLAASLKSAGWFLLLPAVIWWIFIKKILPIRQWLRFGFEAGAVAGFVGSCWLFGQQLLSPRPVIGFYGAYNPPLSWQRILNNDAFERPAIVFRTWWGHVGWSGVSGYNREWVYTMLVILTATILLAYLFWLWRRSWRIPMRVVLLASGALGLEALYQVLYWQAGLREGASHFPLHGRYYLPLIAPFALFFVYGLSAIFPPRVRWIGYTLAVCAVMLATVMIGIKTSQLYVLERAAGW